MTIDRKYDDPALREALRLEQATMPHFPLVDGWQDAVIKRAKTTSRRIVWTAAAAIVVLLIGTATILWQQKTKDRHQELDVLHQEARIPETESPIVIAQVVPAQSSPEPSTEKPKQKRGKNLRKSKQPRQYAVETTKALTPTSLSANRDRMRQAMFKKMNRHSNMTELELEEIDEI